MSKYAVFMDGRIEVLVAAVGEQPRVGDTIWIDENGIVHSQPAQPGIPESSPAGDSTNNSQHNMATKTAVEPAVFAETDQHQLTKELGVPPPSSTFKTPVDLANEKERRSRQAMPAAAVAPVILNERITVKHPARPSTRYERFKKNIAKWMK